MTTPWRVPPVHLACGQPVEPLWEHVRGGDDPGPHAATCPTCLDTLAGLRALRWATGLLRREPGPPAADLVGEVIDLVHAVAQRRGR